MKINSASYIGSYPSIEKCPPEIRPEYAFIGRSNVGKSSLINMLVGRKELARVSKKPGKTQLLNFYLINEAWYIVDLPGYGYAKVAQKTRKKWKTMIEKYLMNRRTLQCAFMLIDANIALQEKDLKFINWMGKMQIPFVIIYTKYDKLKTEEGEEQIKKIQTELLNYWNELPRQFISSSNTLLGRADLLEFIQQVNQQFVISE